MKLRELFLNVFIEQSVFLATHILSLVTSQKSLRIEMVGAKNRGNRAK